MYAQTARVEGGAAVGCSRRRTEALITLPMLTGLSANAVLLPQQRILRVEPRNELAQ